MRRRWPRLGASGAALVLLAGACGGDGDATPTASPGDGRTTVETDASGAPVGEATALDDAGTGDGDQAPSGSAAGDNDGATPGGGGGDGVRTDDDDAVADGQPVGTVNGIAKSIEPACAGRPGSIRVGVETAPFGDVAWASAFSDGAHHGQWGLGQADGNGAFIVVLAVTPTIPEGAGRVELTSGDPRTGEALSGEAVFRISDDAC